MESNKSSLLSLPLGRTCRQQQVHSRGIKQPSTGVPMRWNAQHCQGRMHAAVLYCPPPTHACCHLLLQLSACFPNPCCRITQTPALSFKSAVLCASCHTCRAGVSACFPARVLLAALLLTLLLAFIP
jgi:hypothetical protein